MAVLTGSGFRASLPLAVSRLSTCWVLVVAGTRGLVMSGMHTARPERLVGCVLTLSVCRCAGCLCNGLPAISLNCSLLCSSLPHWCSSQSGMRIGQPLRQAIRYNPGMPTDVTHLACFWLSRCNSQAAEASHLHTLVYDLVLLL